MAYRLALQQPDCGIAKVVRAQLTRLQTDPSLLEQRKSLKKLRALNSLGLTRSNAKHVRRCDRALRAAGRSLGRARDVAALRDTLAYLVEAGLLAQRSLVRLLATELDRLEGAEHNANNNLAFDAVAHPVGAVDRSQMTRESLISAAGLTYRAARRGRWRALARGGSEAAHDWRKSVQRHARHMQLLADLWPLDLEPRIAAAKQIARQLGEEHDLHLFGIWLATLRLPSGQRAPATTLLSAIEKRQRHLRSGAFALGAKVFAERPRCFHARLFVYAQA